MAEYRHQINVKIGDHLVNLTGDSVEEVVEAAEELAALSGRIHAALTALDGRPATEIAAKEWGSRSQSRKPAGGSGGGGWGGKKQGSWGGQQKAAPAVMPTDVPEMYRTCPNHNVPTVFKPAGQNQTTGKPYSARVMCPTQGCDVVKWMNDGSWD